MSSLGETYYFNELWDSLWLVRWQTHTIEPHLPVNNIKHTFTSLKGRERRGRRNRRRIDILWLWSSYSISLPLSWNVPRRTLSTGPSRVYHTWTSPHEPSGIPSYLWPHEFTPSNQCCPVLDQETHLLLQPVSPAGRANWIPSRTGWRRKHHQDLPPLGWVSLMYSCGQLQTVPPIHKIQGMRG